MDLIMAKTVTFFSVAAINGNADAAAAAHNINTRAQGCGWNDEESTMRDEIASCADSIRADLVLESETVEVWQAWLDGEKQNAEMFFVPQSGGHDIAELAAAAVGRDVCAELNMERV